METHLYGNIAVFKRLKSPVTQCTQCPSDGSFAPFWSHLISVPVVCPAAVRSLGGLRLNRELGGLIVLINMNYI